MAPLSSEDVLLNWNRNRFPLNVGSVHTTSSNDALVGLVVIVFVEFDPGDVLGMASESSAVLGVLDTWESVDIQSSKVICSRDKCSVVIDIDGVNICSVSSNREDSRNFPSQLACHCCPQSMISQIAMIIVNLCTSLDIIELLAISLVDDTQVYGIQSPVHSCDG